MGDCALRRQGEAGRQRQGLAVGFGGGGEGGGVREMRNAEFGMRSGLGVFVSATLLIFPVLAENKSPEFTTETIRGKVVFLAEVMEKKMAVVAVPEARERVLALQT